MSSRGDRPAPGAFSALLAEIARVPDLALVRSAPAAGDRVGRFELIRELGRGGFGCVFEARDPELRRTVAVKLIRPGVRGAPDADAAALLHREAEAIAQLQHPNIVTLHDVGSCPAGPFLVMELLRGESLAQRLRRGPPHVRQVLEVARGVGRALAHAHAAGVLHRDLKPGNVFLVDGGPVKVLDFGLAYALGQRGPARSGTPGYMAPEQREGRGEDERTDVHGLGLLVHEMLGGTRGSDGSPGPLEGLSIPPALAALVRRAIAPLPLRRPESAAAVLEALDQVERAWAGRAARARAAPPSTERLGLTAVDRLEAHRQFVLGQQCARYPAMGQDCGAFLRRAVALDPQLAAAQYELAVWLHWFGGSSEDQRAAVASALRHADDAPERERLLIEAWAAQVSGRDDEALATYRRVVAAWPEEVRAWYHAGDLLRHREEPAAAIPWFEQVLALDPEFGWAAAHLAEALGVLGRREALEEWVRCWERSPGVSTLHGLSTAYGWLGDLDAAARAGERAVALGGGAAGREDHLAAMFFSGRFAEAEREARPMAELASPVRRMGFYAMAALEAYQGRRRAGLAKLDEFAREVPAVRGEWDYHALRADYLVGDGDLAGVREEVDALEALDLQVAAAQAVNLAWLGDVERASALATRLPAGSILAEMTVALTEWHRERRDDAVAMLERLCARAPALLWRMAPLYALGELLVRQGRDAEGVDALRRFERLYVWRQMWRSWAWPNAQVRVGEALLRLGDRDGARRVLDRFLDAWREAEPDAPLLVEARAVRAQAGA